MMASKAQSRLNEIEAVFGAAVSDVLPAPSPELPMVAAARERDRQARAALKAGKTLATSEDAVQLRAWRGRRGWRL